MKHLEVVFTSKHRILLSYDQLIQNPNQVDISRLDSTKTGIAIPFKLLVIPTAGEFVNLEAKKDGFFASVPVKHIRDEAYIIFAKNGKQLTEKDGGPYRFYIPNPAACQMAEIDECVNVKYLDRITFSKHLGKDTRPKTKQEHKNLHDQSK
jgi:hypothetical protein